MTESRGMSPGGGHSNSFWWVCAAQVLKSRVYRFVSLKKLGSWKQIFAKISVFGAEILPKLERNSLKMLKIENGGHKN